MLSKYEAIVTHRIQNIIWRNSQIRKNP